MDKNTTKKDKGSFIIRVATAILLIFAFLCIFIIFRNDNSSLVKGVIGIILLIITMNIANLIKVNKEKILIYDIVSLILSFASAFLVFSSYMVIYSYVLTVPAFIISLKAVKKDSRKIVTKFAFAFSTLVFLGLIINSIAGVITTTS